MADEPKVDPEKKVSSNESTESRRRGRINKDVPPPPPPFIAATFPASDKAHHIIKGSMAASTASGGTAEDGNDLDGRRAAKRKAKKLLKEIGGIGWFQVWVYILTLYPNIIAGMVIIQTVFVLGTPPHRCFVPSCEGSDAKYNSPFVKDAIPFDHSKNEYEKCHTFGLEAMAKNMSNSSNSSSFACLGTVTDSSKTKCYKDYYVYDFEALSWTAVTEWGLVCDKAKYASISATIFMSGNLAASICSGWLADKYGRRSVYYWTPIIATIGSQIAAHSTNIWIYTFAGFLQSFTLYSLIGTTFTLGMESVGKEWTLVAGNLYPIAFVCGEMLLALMFYQIRNWRVVLMIITILNLSMTMLPFLSPESIKWLLANKKEYEAVETLEFASKWNRIKFKNGKWRREKPVNDDTIKLDGDDEDGDDVIVDQVGLFDMLKNKILFRWILGDVFSGFVIGLNYYALSLSVETLTGSMNFYLSFTIMAIVEVPFVASLLVSMKYFGRKPLLILSLFAGGAFCLISLAIPLKYSTASLWLGVVAKGFASAASSLKWIYTAELYPTSTRSVGVGLMATAGSVGCLVAPSVASAKFYQNKGPLIICGALSILAGLTCFDLPETKGRELPETIDDVVKLKEGTNKKLDTKPAIGKEMKKIEE